MPVNRTFSKAFGLVGFRVWDLLCDLKLAHYFNRVRIPWNVSLIACAEVLAGLEDVEDQQRKRKNVTQWRGYMYEEVNKMPGLRAYPSDQAIMH